MAIIERLKSILGIERRAEPDDAPFDPGAFVYITLPGNIQPMERGSKFEDRIDPELARHGLGSVSGGGSFLSDPRPDGSRVVESCGIDVDVTDLPAALAVLRDVLPRLDAPAGSELHYTRDGVRLLDRLSGDGWSVGLPRAALHPGFGV